MARIDNIFHDRILAGAIALNGEAVLGQPVRIHQALTRSIAAANLNLLDSSNISEAAYIADEVTQKTAQLTGSSDGPRGIPGVHPIVDGIADLRQFAQRALTRG